MTFVWMKHPDGTQPAPFAADAVEFWEARGWERTEKPEEPDPTVDPAAGAAAQTTADEPPADDTKSRKPGRQRRAESEES